MVKYGGQGRDLRHGSRVRRFSRPSRDGRRFFQRPRPKACVPPLTRPSPGPGPGRAVSDTRPGYRDLAGASSNSGWRAVIRRELLELLARNRIHEHMGGLVCCYWRTATGEAEGRRSRGGERETSSLLTGRTCETWQRLPAGPCASRRRGQSVAGWRSRR